MPPRRGSRSTGFVKGGKCRHADCQVGAFVLANTFQKRGLKVIVKVFVRFLITSVVRLAGANERANLNRASRRFPPLHVPRLPPVSSCLPLILTDTASFCQKDTNTLTTEMFFRGVFMKNLTQDFNEDLPEKRSINKVFVEFQQKVKV